MVQSENRMIELFQSRLIAQYLDKSVSALKHLKIIMIGIEHKSTVTIEEFFAMNGRCDKTNCFTVGETDVDFHNYQYTFNKLKWRLEKHCLDALYSDDVKNQYLKDVRLIEAWPRIKYYLKQQKAWFN